MRDLHIQRQRLTRTAADQLNAIQRQMAALRAVAAGQQPAPGHLSGWQVRRVKQKLHFYSRHHMLGSAIA